MRRLASALSLLASTVVYAAPASAAFTVSVEAPTAQSTTSSFSYVGTENFNGRTTGSNQSFTSNFGTGGSIIGNYSGVNISSANVYGGAGGSGNYATTSTAAGYSIDLSTTNPSGINYFGYWLSALDNGNQISFYKNNAVVYTFNSSTLTSFTAGNPSYNGNPNNGGNSNQAYAFVNFYDVGDTFDKVVIFESPQVGGDESDNHTVGRYTAMSGTVISSVPEPGSWMLLIGGFGFIGAMLRMKRGDRAKHIA